jgi:hypothetical protein
VALITYTDFSQRVRRHRPSELLPALAATAVQFFERDTWTADRVRLPWAIAAAAKASIVAGNEYRSSGVSDKDVFEICAAYNALDSPLTNKADDVSGTVGAFLVRIGHEQFTYQQSFFEEISRLGALFDGLDALETEILNTALIERLLGCSLADFVGAGFVLAIGAKSNAGFFDPEWAPLWEGPNSINGQFSMDIVRQVFQEHFLTTFEDVRTTAKKLEQADLSLRHHEFNPLLSRPFVTLPDGRHIAPQPHFVFQRLSPSALYYAGVEALGKVEANAFTRDMGVVFQEYVGRQLRSMPGAVVLPEIVYDDSQRSVDWFVVFDDVLVLVEVKSTRLSHLARMGGNQLKEDIERCLGKAYTQVARTEELLSRGHSAFTDIPVDRPRIAIVATLEPYWAANTPFVGRFLPEPAIPTTVASMRAIEQLVDVVTVLGGPQPLVDIVTDEDRRTWNLENALPNIDVPRNRILDKAWSRYPFPEDN